MLCAQVLVLGLCLFGGSPTMSASPTDSEASMDPSLVSVEPLGASTSTTTSLSSRFPPREYSFDPRPNIDPGAVIYKPGYPGPRVSSFAESSNREGESVRDSAFGNEAEESPAVTSLLTWDDTLSQDSAGSPDASGKMLSHNSPVDSGEENLGDPPQAEALTADDEEGNDEVERPRAIVDVQSDSLSGEVSYIIHPDNLPPPSYTPIKDLAPPTHPVAQWRPDIFMKVCCSKPDTTPQPDLPDDPQVAAVVSATITQEEEEPSPNSEEQEKMKNSTTKSTASKVDDKEAENSGEEVGTTILQEIVDDANIQSSSDNSSEELILLNNNTDSLRDNPSNHTPRYEEASSSAYQDVTNFLKDIANSEGFKNAFLGDLIKNFGNLDQNAMKLIYSLLIRPLEGAQSTSNKQDRLGEAEDTKTVSSRLPVTPQDLMVLDRDRLPLRDRPANGYQPFRSLFPQNRLPTARRPPIRPSSLVRQERPSLPSDESWRPSRTFARLPSNGRRGDEGVDVITAPPFQNFEVVLGSSLNHEIRKQGLPIPPKTPGLPFDKLTLGLKMPPPDALEALPPGSVLIPPSQILGRPKLPQIHHTRQDTSNFEMPLKEFLPNLPFINQPSRLRPPAQPQIQDIPPRLPSILSSLLPGAPPPRPVRPPRPVVQPPRSSGLMGTSNQRPIFSERRQPTGPPPPVSKLTPPGQRVPPLVPTVRLPQPVHHDSTSTSNFVRPDAVPDTVSGPVFVTVSSPTMHVPGAVPPIEQEGAEAVAQHETPSGSHLSVASAQEVTSELEANLMGPVTDMHDDYHAENGVIIPGNPLIDHQAPVAVYYHDIPPEYIPDYYEVDYRDYYAGHTVDADTGEDTLPAADFDTNSQYHRGDMSDMHYYDEEGHNSDIASVATTTTLMPSVKPQHDSHLESHNPNQEDSSVKIHPSDMDHSYENGHQPKSDNPYMADHQSNMNDFSPEGYQHDLHDVMQESHQADPYLKGHHLDVYDILDMTPDTVIPTLTEQEKNDLQMLLQNHRMATALAESNGTVVNLVPTAGGSSASDDDQSFRVKDGAADSSPASSEGEMPNEDGHEYYPQPATGYHESWEPTSKANVASSEHNTSISQLWNNVRLIPLAPELFNDGDNEDNMNLTSLFEGAVPLSPISSQDDFGPNLNSDVEKITIKSGDGHFTVTEEVIVEDDKADAKFMAYVLIGACCGLALLSVTGVIVILRFKKTCGSRQIKTRTRLTEQESVENISRRVENLTLGGESGHKLGSWFTGRNEQFGSGKLRSNMALPAVHDLKREKNGTSGSTRDLLSISSESSGSNSPNQPHRGGEASVREEEEEPRASWLHDEYRASASDLSQAEAQDLAYIPHQYQQQTRASPHAISTKQTDHQRFRQESSAEAEHLERSVRERRYTGQSRQDGRRGPQYMMSMESELEERMAGHDPRYTTDSELEDGTTQYDDDESRDPSRYFSDSRELEDVITSRRGDPDTMTSQELGENLSRDLKQYQSRRVSHLHHQQQSQQQQQKQQEARESHPPETSSQEVEGEDGSRELRRSQSQVSFSRDNVQNEVFLEFDSMLRQHGQYLQSEPPNASTLGRASRGTDRTNLSVSRANTPDSIDLPEDFSVHSRHHDHADPPPSPPRFSPPPPPPRPPKPGHLSEPGTPSPRANRARPPSPGHSPPSPPRSNQRPVYWTSEEERLI